MSRHQLVEWTFVFSWVLPVVLILGGCGTTVPVASATLAPRLSASASSTPTVSAPDSSPSPTTSALPCQSRQLQLVFDRGGVGLGNAGTQYFFENQSKTPCTLVGYPALQLLDAQHQTIQGRVLQETQAYMYSTRAPQQILLQTGAKAYFVIEWVDIGCATKIAFLDVTPPGNHIPVLISFQGCAYQETLMVSPLEPNKVLGVFV